MILHVGSILHSYTGGRSELECKGNSIRAVLADLERQCPGTRFRLIDEQDGIRQHIKIFVGKKLAQTIDESVGAEDEVHILGALSGG